VARGGYRDRGEGRGGRSQGTPNHNRSGRGRRSAQTQTPRSWLTAEERGEVVVATETTPSTETTVNSTPVTSVGVSTETTVNTAPVTTVGVGSASTDADGGGSGDPSAVASASTEAPVETNSLPNTGWRNLANMWVDLVVVGVLLYWLMVVNPRLTSKIFSYLPGYNAGRISYSTLGWIDSFRWVGFWKVVNWELQQLLGLNTIWFSLGWYVPYPQTSIPWVWTITDTTPLLIALVWFLIRGVIMEVQSVPPLTTTRERDCLAYMRCKTVGVPVDMTRVPSLRASIESWCDRSKLGEQEKYALTAKVLIHLSRPDQYGQRLRSAYSTPSNILNWSLDKFLGLGWTSILAGGGAYLMR